MYSGKFEKGMKWGYGLCKWPDSHGENVIGEIVYSTNYIGDWMEDKFHGRGILVYTNGNIYDGDWKQGMKHGEGCLSFHDGSKYRGSWFKN